MWKIFSLFLYFSFICWRIKKDYSNIFHVLNLRESFEFFSNISESFAEKLSIFFDEVHFWDTFYVLNKLEWFMEDGGMFFKIEERSFNLKPEIVNVLIERMIDVNDSFNVKVLICFFSLNITPPVFHKLLMVQILPMLITNCCYCSINYFL